MRSGVRAVVAVAAGLVLPGFVQAQGIADAAKREKSRIEQAKEQPARVYTNVAGSTVSANAAGTAPKTAAAEAPGAAGADAPPPAASSTAAPAPASAAAPAPVESSPVAALAQAPRPAAVAAPAAASRRGPAAPGPSPDRVATAETARDVEVYWRARARVAQAAIDDAQSRIDQLEGEAAEASEAEAAAPTGPCAQAVEDARNGARARRSSGKRACDVEVMRVRRSQALDAALDDARRQLDAARGAQEALLDEARRAGVRSDWLR